MTPVMEIACDHGHIHTHGRDLTPWGHLRLPRPRLIPIGFLAIDDQGSQNAQQIQPDITGPVCDEMVKE
jgi:hypothetical protein